MYGTVCWKMGRCWYYLHHYAILIVLVISRWSLPTLSWFDIELVTTEDCSAILTLSRTEPYVVPPAPHVLQHYSLLLQYQILLPTRTPLAPRPSVVILLSFLDLLQPSHYCAQDLIFHPCYTASKPEPSPSISVATSDQFT